MSFNVQNAGDKDIYVPWSDGNNRRLLRITDSTGEQIWVHKFHLNLTAGEGGTVDGGGRFKYMKSTNIKAIPNDKYEFVQWSDGNTNANRTVQMNQKNDINLHATFKLAGNYVHYHYFDNDNEIRETKFIEYGQPATDPDFVVNKTSELSEKNWIFKKWKNTNGGVEFGQPITEETHYYGQWELKKNLGTFSLDGGVDNQDSSDKQTYPNLYFPKNGKINCNMRCDGSHGASVNGHRIIIDVRLAKVYIPELQLCRKTMTSPKTKNKPIGLVMLPESIVLTETYDQLILWIGKDPQSGCVVQWTFDGNIVMVLD